MIDRDTIIKCKTNKGNQYIPDLAIIVMRSPHVENWSLARNNGKICSIIKTGATKQTALLWLLDLYTFVHKWISEHRQVELGDQLGETSRTKAKEK